MLRPAGWAAFTSPNDPDVHRLRGGHGWIGGLLRRAPRGQRDRAWLGSAIDLDSLTETAASAEMDVERVEGAGTQFCLVLLRRRG